MGAGTAVGFCDHTKEMTVIGTPYYLSPELFKAYREKMQRSRSDDQTMMMNHSLERIAGIYNSGTNAMAHFLNLNLKTYENYKQRNVPWGKQ